MSTTSGTADPVAVLRDGLDHVDQTLHELHAIDLHDVPGETLHQVLADIELVSRKVEALSAKAASVTEANGLWATSGARSYTAWLRQRTGRHGATASRLVKLSRALRDHLPATAEALQEGEISIDHATALARHAVDTPHRIAQLADRHMGEEFLLAQAKSLDASSFTTVVRHWGLRADPDAADRAWQEESEREELTLAKTTGGYFVRGWLGEAAGECLATALDARIGTPPAGDRRTPAQRRASALTSLARLALDSGRLQPGARIRPHVAVTVPFDTLERLIEAAAPVPAYGNLANGNAITSELDLSVLVGAEAATLPDGSPIPHSLLARLACQSQMHRVIFGPDSEVLDSGREERLFTPGQTRAVIARDRHCQYPDCHAPPNEGEIHHSIWWYAQHGATRISEAVLLCWYHHDYVHRCSLTITRFSGTWVFTRSDGAVIGSAPVQS